MKRVIINKQALKKLLERPVTDRLFTLVKKSVLAAVREANQELVEQFRSNPLTIEIENGPNSPSTVLYKGNLFSFLGFEDGSTPVEDLANFLANAIKVKSITRISSSMSVRIEISLPNKAEIKGFSELPWVNKSWVDAIEKGISGLGGYLYSEDGFETSRSTTGIQVKRNYESGMSLTSQSYLTDMIKDVSKKLILSIRNELV